MSLAPNHMRQQTKRREIYHALGVVDDCKGSLGSAVQCLKNYMHDADFIIIEDPTLNPLLSEIEFGEEVERRLERIDNLKEYEETVNRRRNHNK
eukprot:149291_1